MSKSRQTKFGTLGCLMVAAALLFSAGTTNASAPSNVPLIGVEVARSKAPQVLASCKAHRPWRVDGATGVGKKIALTFDDGPSAHTRGILKILKQRRVAATFFVVGSQVQARPKLVKRAAAQGHQIANHSYNHPNLARSSPNRITSELRKTNRLIRKLTGSGPCAFRAPYGAESASVIRVAKSEGMITVNWNVDPRDWATPGTSAIIHRTVSATRAGSVLLLHDGGGNRKQTAAALPKIIHKLRKSGYKFVTVAELFELKPVYAEPRTVPIRVNAGASGRPTQ